MAGSVKGAGRRYPLTMIFAGVLVVAVVVFPLDPFRAEVYELPAQLVLASLVLAHVYPLVVAVPPLHGVPVVTKTFPVDVSPEFWLFARVLGLVSETFAPVVATVVEVFAPAVGRFVVVVAPAGAVGVAVAVVFDKLLPEGWDFGAQAILAEGRLQKIFHLLITGDTFPVEGAVGHLLHAQVEKRLNQLDPGLVVALV